MHWFTHQEHKKSADPHQAAENSVENFFSEVALPHIDLFGSRHLAVSNGRLPDPVSRITPDAQLANKPAEAVWQIHRIGTRQD
jgi:hypothetical protein